MSKTVKKKRVNERSNMSLRRKLSVTLLLSVIIIVLLLSCSQKKSYRNVLLATTTSTYDSGLLDELIPTFEKENDYWVMPIAVGTGEAISMGKKGIVDAILVHSKQAEERFVQEGFGINRKDVMYNDFVIVGPGSDPAGVKGLSVAGALEAISEKKEIFVSRGDNSGTNKKEKLLWEISGINPTGEWYIESGQGMGFTLEIADEKNAYSLTDRATFISFSSSFNSLEVVIAGDEILFNPYGIIQINPLKHRSLVINFEGALAFVDFITGDQGQKIIKNFGIEKYGQNLFYPY